MDDSNRQLAAPASASHLHVESDHELTVLPGGLRVVTERIPSVASASLGFFIGVGSRSETDAEAGLSHFIEHLLFRGTKDHDSSEINHLFDAMGAEINGGTDKETTSIFARLLATHLPEAFAVMAEMIWRPTLREVDPERTVVIEEIAMYEDDPQDSVFDILGRSVFPNHPLGRPIVGRQEVVRDTPIAQIAAFHARHYVPGAVVIAAAGAVDHEEVVGWAQETWAGERKGQTVPQMLPAPETFSPTLRFINRETEQCHLCIGGPSLARTDDRRFALRLLDSIFGGLSSSRLFKSVRDQHGLAYAVMSFCAEFSDTGELGLYLGTRPDNVDRALELVKEELDRLVDSPATAKELERTRENVKARTVLALESTSARMSRLGISVLLDMPILEVDEIIDRFDAVTLDDLKALAVELWAPDRLSGAVIGPQSDSLHGAMMKVCPAAELISST